MDALLLLLTTLGLAALVFHALSRGGIGSTAARRRRRRTIVVSDPGIAKLMLIDRVDAYSTRHTAHFHMAGFGGTPSINSAAFGGPLWRALRCNLTSGVLHPTRLHLVAPLQEEAAGAIVADLSAAAAPGGGVVVVRHSLHAAVFALSARLCFGDGVGAERYVPALERELLSFVQNFAQDGSFFGGSGLLTRLRHWRRWLRYSGTFGRVYRLIRPIIVATRRRRQQIETTGGGGGGDVVGVSGIRSYVDSLLDLHVVDDDDDSGTTPRPLTDRKIAGLVFEFLGANTVSLAANVEWTLAHLVLQPEVQEKLHREIAADDAAQQQHNNKEDSEARLIHHRLPYLRAVMLESLRLHPPVTILRDHVAAEDAEEIIIAGATATPGSASAADSSSLPAMVFTDALKIGRNSKDWTDPDEFRPERFLAGGEAAHVGPVPGPNEIRMLPFGAGPRYCPGVGIGMLRVGCILAALVRHFRWAPPDDGADAVDLKEFRGFFTKMKTPLRAHITPRAL